MEDIEMNRKYNGYTNRLTWLVSLHINNDERLYNIVQKYISTLSSQKINSSETILILASYIQSLISDILENDAKELLTKDIINDVLDNIDFIDIASSMVLN